MVLTEKNISKYYFLHFFSYQHFIGAILILYFLELGYSLVELIVYGLTLQFVLTSLLEIPTGMFSDKHTRKLSLIFSGIGMLIGSFLLLFSENKLLFIIAIVFVSFGHAFYSGALQAWFYDTLKELKKEELYKKIEGKAQLITQIGMAITTILGAYLFQLETKLPFFLLFIFQVVWFISILTISEPKRKKSNQKYLVHFKKSIRYIMYNSKLKMLIYINTTVFLFYLSFMYVFNQIYLLEFKFSPFIIGLFLVILRIIMSLGSFFANKITLEFRKEYFILLISQGLLLLCIGLLNNYFSLILLIVLFLIFGIYSVTLSNQIHKLSTSKYRSTIFSIQSLLNNLIFGVGILVYGIIVNTYSTSVFFLISGILILMLGFMYYIVQKNIT